MAETSKPTPSLLDVEPHREPLTWAFREAPVPRGPLMLLLAAVALYADKDGRGAAPTVGNLAYNVGKSVGQTRRDIRRLRDLGLLTLGDQSLVEHLPPGQRPVVYDLPLHLKDPDLIRYHQSLDR